MPAPGAKRFEVGTVYRPAVKAMGVNLEWLSEAFGWQWMYSRIATLAEQARGALLSIPEVDMVTPAGAGSASSPSPCEDTIPLASWRSWSNPTSSCAT